jgi:hypothetical protein
MPVSTRFRRMARTAGLRLTLFSAGIMGFSFLLVQVTTWRVSNEKEPFYRFLPGVEMTSLSAATGQAVLERLNLQRCPCDCARTVASCRNHHGSCSLSLVIARRAVEASKSGR